METILSVRECADGWRIFQAGRPLFWLPAYEDALATARMIAAVQVDIRETPTRVEMQLLGEQPVHVYTLAPT